MENGLEHLVLLLWVPLELLLPGAEGFDTTEQVDESVYSSNWNNCADRKNSKGLSMHTYAHMTTSAMRVAGATTTVTSAALAIGLFVICNHPQISAVFCNESYHICKLGNGQFKIHCDRIRHIFHWPDELVVLGEEFVK